MFEQKEGSPVKRNPKHGSHCGWTESCASWFVVYQPVFNYGFYQLVQDFEPCTVCRSTHDAQRLFMVASGQARRALARLPEPQARAREAGARASMLQ